MRATHGFLLALYVLLVAPWTVTGDSLRCYTCVSLGEDLTCLNDPDSVTNNAPITTCEMDDKVCCTIDRIEYKEEKDKIQSFSRGCRDNCPKDGFEMVEDATYYSYMTYCSTPECNFGPGNKPLSSSSRENKENEIWNILGKDAGVVSNPSYLTLITCITTLLLLFGRF